MQIAANRHGLAKWRHLKTSILTKAKFITKSSSVSLLLNGIRWLVLNPISEQKVENIFVACHIAKPHVGCSSVK